MEIVNLKTEEVSTSDQYLLSFPLKMKQYRELSDRLNHYPLILLNQANEIVFGIDFYEYLRSQNMGTFSAIKLELSTREALFLNYNLKSKFTGVNLYEKLTFIKKAIPIADHQEIYKGTALDIPISNELIKNLDILLSHEFKPVLIDENITLKTASGLCKWHPGNRPVMLRLFANVPFSSSHQLKLLEMIEEILFREKTTLSDIFTAINLDELMEIEKPQRAIIDKIYRLRNPMYYKSEQMWQDEVNQLKLPKNIQVSHSPYFEKKQLTLTIQLTGMEDLKKIASQFMRD